MIKKKIHTVIGSASILLLASAHGFSAENSVIYWNEQILDAIRATSPGPTITARALNITSTCAFDAWAAFDKKAIATQAGSKFRRPASEHTLANKMEAVNYAFYRAAVDLFPTRKDQFDQALLAAGYFINNNSADLKTPAGIANVSCDAVLAYKHKDGSNQLGDLNPGAYSDYTNYQPVNTPTNIADPARWQPLSIPQSNGTSITQKSLTPHWGKVKPFALKSINQYKIKTPAKWGTTEYKEQVKEIISYSASLTDQQKVIAEYWADGPKSELPPGHWNIFAQYVSKRDGHSLDQDIKMFFSLNNAMLDSSIWAWGMKVKYDYVRPVTAVNYLMKDQLIAAWGGPGMGTKLISGSAWRPYQAINVVTPPFAEYVSGHSTFSAAGAAVLQAITQSDVFGFGVTIPAGNSNVEPGLVPANPLTLSWATFSDAANEASISRRYGGIHFKDGDLEARRVGKMIGEAAYKLSSYYITGRENKMDGDTSESFE